MARSQPEIMLVSNFEEFRELRQELGTRLRGPAGGNAHVIDLDDGTPRSRPPLEHSLAMARQADVVIVLVGETYGGVPEGSTKSYAHLEYEAAVDSGIVLVYSTPAPSVADERLAEWRAQLNLEVTVASFPRAGAADLIVGHVLDALFQRSVLSDSGPPSDEGLGNLSPEDLDAADSAGSGWVMGYGRPRYRPPLSEGESVWPNRVSADEQWNEAVHAREADLKAVMVGHLREAVRLRPLDDEASFWLARFDAATSRRAKRQSAIDLAVRAAGVSEHVLGTSKRADMRRTALRAAAAYLVAARAARLVDQLSSAADFVDRALKHAPQRSEVHVELAVQAAARGDEAAALRHGLNAFVRWPRSLADLRREPEIVRQAGLGDRLEERCRAFAHSHVEPLRDLHARLDAWARANRLGSDDGSVTVGSLDGRDSLQLVGLGRSLARSMLADLSRWSSGLVLVAEQLAAHRSTAVPDPRLALPPTAGAGPQLLGTVKVASGVAFVGLVLAKSQPSPTLGVLMMIGAAAWLGSGAYRWLVAVVRHRRAQLDAAQTFTWNQAQWRARDQALQRGLDSNVTAFMPWVAAFEQHVLTWRALSPGGAYRPAWAGRLTHVPVGAGLPGRHDFSCLAPAVASMITVPQQQPPTWVLGRKHADGGVWRWQAYLDSETTAALPSGRSSPGATTAPVPDAETGAARSDEDALAG